MNKPSVEVNLNGFAKVISLAEGKHKEVNIAQIKEILRIIFTTTSLEYIFLVWLKFNKNKK